MTANEGTGAPVEAPDWFARAIDHPLTEHQVDVEGCAINYLRWSHQGPSPTASMRERSGLLFVHGGGAHARWWQFIAPFFSAEFECAAIDLSGMGESGFRDVYSSEQRAREVGAVLRDAGFGADSYIVGHSLGGFIGMRFGALFGEDVAGVVIVDSPIRRPDALPLEPPPRLSRHKVYATLDEALKRFRVLPNQPCENQYVLDFIARNSVREVDGGWQWKFDPVGMGPQQFGRSFREQLQQLKCRGALMYGEKSALVDDETAAYMSELMGPEAPIVAIPDAYHHVMLDQPLAFVAALRGVLAAWRQPPA